MEQRKAKVLVVDDSSFLRKLMVRLMAENPAIEVVGEARNGKEALELTEKLRPDVITLDINMPVMDGLTALKEIMNSFPTPVIMVSSLTTEDAQITFEALEKGAVEFFPKQTADFNANIKSIKDELVPKILTIAQKKMALGFPFRSFDKPLPQPPSPSLSPTVLPSQAPTIRKGRIGDTLDMVVLGSSTGGPRALQDVLTVLPENFPAAILVSQHMPATFTGPFAERLNRLCKVHVKEAAIGDKIERGSVFITPGGQHMTIRQSRPAYWEIFISEEPKSAIYKPSVNVMAQSVADNYKKNVAAVMLTGMGNDGRDGFVSLKKKNRAVIIAQDEESCVVYGMPKAVVDAGIADYVLPVKDIGETLDRVVLGNLP